MPRSRRRLNRPAARAEPVEPPETSACALPSATARAAWTIEASGVERTANAGSAAFAIETGASTISTPGPTDRISAAGPKRTTPIPWAAARVAPSATSWGPRSAPPASTATVTMRAGVRAKARRRPERSLRGPCSNRTPGTRGVASGGCDIGGTRCTSGRRPCAEHDAVRYGREIASASERPLLR